MKTMIFYSTFFCMLLLLGCPSPQMDRSSSQTTEVKQTKDSSLVLAWLEEKPVYKKDFDEWLKLQRQNLTNLPTKRKKQLLQRYLHQRLLLLAAQNAGYNTHPSALWAMNREMIRLYTTSHEQRDNSKTPTEQVLLDYYQSHTEQFMRYERRRISLMFVRCEKNQHTECDKKAENIAEKLKSGQSFSALAKLHSEDSFSRYRGGDVGFLFHPKDPYKQNKLLELAVQQAAFKLQNVGDIAFSIRGKLGIYFVQLTAKLPSQQLDFNSQRTRIQALCLEKQKQTNNPTSFAFLQKKYGLRLHP